MLRLVRATFLLSLASALALTLTAHDAHADTPSSASEVGAGLCGTRTGCAVDAVTWAGRNLRGEALHVVTLKLPFRDAGACGQATCNCQPYEYWRVVGAGGPQRAQKVLEACTDDDNPGGLARQLEVGANRLTYHERDASVWASERSVLVQLDPPRLLHETWSGWSSYSPHNRESAEWSWRKFGGNARWTIPGCTESGEAPDGTPSKVFRYAYLPIPRVTSIPAFLWEGWRSSGLEPCSARATADGASGFVTRGKPGARADAALYAVATPRALYVEVVDDRASDGDQLKVWMVDAPAAYSDHCRAEAPTAHTWTIRAGDGAVLSSESEPIQVEQVRVEGRTRFKLSMPVPETAGLAVSYVDADDGEPREIATAELSKGDASAVGPQFVVDADAARCVLVRSVLTPRMSPPRASTTPLVLGRPAGQLSRPTE
ncbi:MAG: hypothetical protein ABW252_05575 [Polyangiales bacterium]